ncbi:putative RNA polymerase II subunit B1 CTD phosphatase rpap2 [Procambarus clarkii]|uniref:putative RNA polymerase II subunit B1 CTD phosphatase rpap2 n=1 Tax=Procambarus clarkii TaxID=6728 RepID=UPI001E672734|nr:putative RNA polymerase II subunit B1 CTD phosphatase rpap2 [Procambarus clarkii]XP_045608151.1 putative RNA polymerase II subunit B1 CTD phosphatase rpap2 [Procambarus clarkii]XP_045608152.1 putative RNA polymerase II subunit B1 CTD phosphatase rpap2 [Procambarus clarkii]XP_045608154.1 putative RNA polymerase II subunit B1 CTD phosphatase rpap2 [Procambarus clarkii]XP_045608155.1 putative RNA polymerase II subunit B1 CTD phosphatase rpap2 [Procambarus clarkii]
MLEENIPKKTAEDTVGHGTNKPSRREESFKITSDLAKEAKHRAQGIYLSMILNAVSPLDFVKQARYINPSIYDDIVNDRSTTSLCGYPLCSRTFEDVFGNRSYIIRRNKIYDISVRRYFCSNVCFEASEIVRKQLATDPLYLRHTGNADIKTVKIPVLKKLRGRYGKYVDITGGLLNLEDDDKAEKKKSFTSISEIVTEALTTCSENKGMNDESKSKNRDQSEKDNMSKGGRKDKGSIPEMVDTNSKSDVKDGSLPKASNEKIIKDENPLVAVYQVEQALREWMSFDSLRTVLGDKYVRGMLEHINRTWEDYDTTSGLRLGIDAKGKYIAICHKLDHEEMAEDLQIEITDDAGAKQCTQKLPLPDYQQLQRDAKKLQLKVVSFIGGSEQYEETVFSQQDKVEGCPDSATDDISTVKALDEKGSQKESQTNEQKLKSKKKKKKKNEEVDIEGSTLPFIDNYSQVAWRQNIVEEKTSAYLRQILEATDLDGREVRRLHKTLIATFDLSPQNICFKPRQWRLISLILLKMLTVRYSAISEALKGEQAMNIQKKVLSCFDLDLGYYDRVLSYLTEINYIISKNFKEEDKKIQQSVDFCEKNLQTQVGSGVREQVPGHETNKNLSTAQTKAAPADSLENLLNIEQKIENLNIEEVIKK